MHARIGHDLAEIRNYSCPIARFSLKIGIKRSYPCFGAINSKMIVPRIAAALLVLQLECRKQLLI